MWSRTGGAIELVFKLFCVRAGLLPRPNWAAKLPFVQFGPIHGADWIFFLQDVRGREICVVKHSVELRGLC